MKLEVEAKLLGIISQFKNRALESYAFKEKVIGKKNHLILELGFYDDDGEQSTMVLVLDKNLTMNDCEDLYEEIIK
jgi:hypothetical protein